jgi:hypothetical protein
LWQKNAVKSYFSQVDSHAAGNSTFLPYVNATSTKSPRSYPYSNFNSKGRGTYDIYFMRTLRASDGGRLFVFDFSSVLILRSHFTAFFVLTSSFLLCHRLLSSSLSFSLSSQAIPTSVFSASSTLWPLTDPFTPWMGLLPLPPSQLPWCPW